MTKFILASKKNSGSVFNEDLCIKTEQNEMLCELKISGSVMKRKIDLVRREDLKILASLQYNSLRNAVGLSKINITIGGDVVVVISELLGKMLILRHGEKCFVRGDLDRQYKVQIVDATGESICIYEKNPMRKLFNDLNCLAAVEVNRDADKLFCLAVLVAFWIIPGGTPFP